MTRFDVEFGANRHLCCAVRLPPIPLVLQRRKEWFRFIDAKKLRADPLSPQCEELAKGKRDAAALQGKIDDLQSKRGLRASP